MKLIIYTQSGDCVCMHNECHDGLLLLYKFPNTVSISLYSVSILVCHVSAILYPLLHYLLFISLLCLEQWLQCHPQQEEGPYEATHTKAATPFDSCDWAKR